MRRLLRSVLGMVAALAAGLSGAVDYPDKPIRWIIDFPPAGVSDILTRTVGQKLTEYLGQQVVIDNRAGAAGTIGAEHVAKSAPDDAYEIDGDFFFAHTTKSFALSTGVFACTTSRLGYSAINATGAKSFRLKPRLGTSVSCSDNGWLMKPSV